MVNKLKALIVALTITAIAIPQGLAMSTIAQFSDLDSNHTYYYSVYDLKTRGIVNGDAEGNYNADTSLNRAEMAKILVEATVGSKPGSMFDYECFDDVQAGEWYTPYICYMSEYGIVNGYPDGTFKPSQAVNFVEATKMTLGAFEMEYNEDMEPWYKDIVDVAAENYFIPITIMAFDAEITRGEMADMVARVLHDSEGTLDEFLSDSLASYWADFPVTYETIEKGIDVSIDLSFGYPSIDPMDLYDLGNNKYRINGYTFEVPDNFWVNQEEDDGRILIYDFADDLGYEEIGSINCPIIETGYIGWEISSESEEFMSNGELYGATIWLGTPQEGEEELGTLLLGFIYPGDDPFNLSGDEFNDTCQFGFSSKAAEYYVDELEEILDSVDRA